MTTNNSRYVIYSRLYRAYFEQFYHGHAEWIAGQRSNAKSFSEKQTQDICQSLGSDDVVTIMITENLRP